MHSLGFIHRDLKPENILVFGKRSNPYKQYLKVTDFGVGKVADVSVAKTAVGTKVYMAPEVMLEDSYKKECDIWSLCITFVYLVLNGLPMDPKSRGTDIVNYYNLTKFNEPLPKLTPHVSVQFQKIIFSGLKYKAGKRASLDDMYKKLV